jgi:Tfp pilus assembly protein PilV
MNKEKWKNNKGQSLVEVLIALSIFVLGVAAIGLLILDASVSSRQSVERTQATLLAKEGLEASRSLRDADFDNLAAGTHGLALSSDVWTFSGTSDTQGQFTRSITISDIDVDTKKVDSSVTWAISEERQGTVVLTDYLTDWIQTHGDGGEDFIIDTSDAYVSGKELRDISIENTSGSSVTVDKITTYWSDSSIDIEEINIDGTKVWSKSGPGSPSGKQSSGTEIDIQNFTLSGSSGKLFFDKMLFDDDIADNNLLIKFIMTDSSTKYSLMDFSGGDASGLAIYTNNAEIDDKELKDVEIENIGSQFLSIDKITISWSGSSAQIKEVNIDGTKVWSEGGPGSPSGLQNSGTELDIENYTLEVGSGVVPLDKIQFEDSVEGATFDFTFTLGNETSSSTGPFTP